MAASPNPAYHQVTASFSLPRDVRQAGLAVYDANGRPVPAGIFFMRLQTDGLSKVQKVVLMR